MASDVVLQYGALTSTPARNSLFNVGLWLPRDRRLLDDQLIGVYKQHHVPVAQNGAF